MFGNLTPDAFRHDMMQDMAVLSGLFTGLIVLGLITYYKQWPYLWKEWITTVDPKRIGIMYIVVVLIMFLKGFADAFMMRLQQALAVGDSHGIHLCSHFQEVFSAHGTTMIFFVAMGFMFGLMNLIIPLQIGASDVAFPFLNALGFWLFAAGAMLTLISLAIGKFSAAGWLAYPPLSGIEYSPNEGVDYWIWMVQIAGIGSTIVRDQFSCDDPEDALSGNDFHENADLCLELLMLHGPCDLCLSDLDSHLAMLTLDRYLGHAFFHGRRRRQSR